ncbi:MAG: PKD domain-containing protein, partial [Pedosphaera parvula]|nr:PKD domain-containing protein [Pedosphaera parvula]
TANRIAAPGSPVETTSAIGHETTYGAGKSVEYGDAWSLQGANSAGHFNASEKSQLGWLPDAGVRLFNAAGGDTVRVHSLESDVQEEGKKYAIRVRRSSDREYWFQYRTTVAGNSFLTNGLQITWRGNAETPGSVDLLDATPNSNPSYSGNRADSALPLGRTFHDPVINLFVTPISQSGTGTTAYLDVVVNIGLFPTNVAPVFASLTSDTNNINPGDTVVFTANATDPNFDPLAYYWTFDDNGVAPSAATVSHTFASAGEYVVRCVVSDMKGGSVSKSMVIRAGNPNTYRIGGVIRDADLNPIPDVRVDNGVTGAGYRYGYTDSDGTYVIAGIPNGSYMVGAW